MTRTSTADLQGGWDPWWFTPAKQNSHDPNKAILWACQAGRLWRSTDCGATWLEVTPDTDPDNDWGWATAPMAAGVTYVQRVDSIHTNKQHIFLAEYQDPVTGEWGAWLLKTDDDGTTGSWTWQSLGGAGVSQGFTFDTDAEGWVLECEKVEMGGPVSMIWSNVDGHTAPGAIRSTITKNAGASSTVSMCYTPVTPIVVNTGDTFSGWFKGSAGGQCGGVDFYIIYTDGTSDTDFSIDPAGWVQVTVTVPAGSDGKQVDYFKIRVTSGPACGGPATYINYIDDINLALGGGDVRPIWADLDTQDGTVLWLTVWRGDTLYLEKRNVADLALAAGYSMGACTALQLAVKTYIAYPLTPEYDKNTVFVFGRLNNPQGLGMCHAIKTVNDGGAWSVVENGWGADHCSAFRTSGVTAGGRQFYAVRSGVGNAPRFYHGVEALALRASLPFAAGAGVGVDAMTVNAADAGQVAVGSDVPGAVMIARADAPYVTWEDITGSYPVTGSVSSLTFV